MAMIKIFLHKAIKTKMKTKWKREEREWFMYYSLVHQLATLDYILCNFHIHVCQGSSDVK